MDLSTFAVAAGLGWTSGLRFYATLFFLGVLHRTGLHPLPASLEPLAHPWVMSIAGVLFLTEFLADKIPLVDSLWDALNTAIRIPGGALLAAAAVASQDPGLALAGGLLGGTVATATHLAKSGGRALLNVSPEPVSNWTASLAEDALTLGLLWTALKYPLLLAAALLVFALLLLWLLPRLWHGIRELPARLSRVFRRTRD